MSEAQHPGPHVAPGGTDPPPVAVLAPTGRDAELIAGLLARAGVAHEVLSSLDELLARPLDGLGPLVVAREALRPDSARLCAALDAQPSWSDVPLVLFLERSTDAAREPLAGRRGTTLLRRPVEVATFVTVTRAAVTDRRRQFALARLVADLQRAGERHQRRADQMRSLAYRLTTAEETERRRLALVLHDDLQQLLVAAQYRARIVLNRLADGKDPLAATEDLAALLAEAVRRSRSLSHELSPPSLRLQGLASALAWLGGRMHEHHGLTVALDAGGDDDDGPPDEQIDHLVYRVVQELLFNVVKHAQTDHARVRLDVTPSRISVVVADDGRGFDASAAAVPDLQGFGLFSIRERLELIGGRLDIDSAPGAGTRCRIVVPRRTAPAVDAEDERPRRGPLAERLAAAARTRVRVVLADDHRVVRAGLRSLLLDAPGIEVVAEAENGREAVAAVASLAPDVVVMDVSMPELDGITATRQIKAARPATRVIGLSMFAQDVMAQKMLEAGAEAYLLKSDAAESLVAAVVEPRVE